MSEASLRRQPPRAEPSDFLKLGNRLREAGAVTAELFSDVIREACWRLPLVPRSGRIERLIQSGAWTDAALGLIEMELPQWQLRRVTYDAGKWRCALSRRRELPDWLDQSVEACHADLSLAILSSFVEAQCVRTLPAGTSVPGVHRADKSFYVRLCCDNFA